MYLQVQHTTRFLKIEIIFDLKMQSVENPF